MNTYLSFSALRFLRCCLNKVCLFVSISAIVGFISLVFKFIIVVSLDDPDYLRFLKMVYFFLSFSRVRDFDRFGLSISSD